MTKAWAPGCWEVSGGAAQAGEESREAVLREVKKRPALMHGMLTAVICLLTNVKIRARGDNYFVDVYRFIMDVKR